MEATYRISRRIEAEERALDAAAAVFTSTGQEVAEQWGLYDGCVCVGVCVAWRVGEAGGRNCYAHHSHESALDVCLT